MIIRIIRPAIILIILLLLQILVLNNIQFSGYVNPYAYLLFILLLPVEMPSWILLLLSFGTGLLIDIFTGSPGMHSAATTLAGFVRPYVLKVVSPRDGYEPGATPSMAAYGFNWFLIYALVIVAIHHFALFYLEVFRLADFFRTLLRVILSTVFSTTFILLFEFIRRGK